MSTDRTQEEWDRHWMAEALIHAQRAAALDEVPVGAVVVKGNQLISAGFNQPISSQDPTAHAEVVALRAAAKVLGNYRMPGTTLYVTLEPCSMCAGAIIHGRVDRLVYAATEPKAGVVHSQEQFFERPYLNHRLAVTSGVEASIASQMLSDFFQLRRQQKREAKLSPDLPDSQ
ncbi:tRNA adenosine(34) deaminase TadA [Simiduia aestuariiviva]|uniref:tRNA-specific adenosine deaminase n=1 Tax=Simiduia aestuariiviva TaxID=1510459 RepID=A0A839UTH8_9GAMM|nr:tRNA adenosine(34) deaminase TadA [Simiduia aestuariiviva]MBB3168808.1 tRNA(Arg) A34 adenosine deaminase TadA [Simiduia aestuariiviva]